MSGVLVACVGNIFRCDDGFGSAVASHLRAAGPHALPDGVRLVDFGIRSVHLVYELLDGYDVLVLVDTVARQEGPPGTVFVIEPDLPASGGPEAGAEELPAALMDPHDLPPASALDLVPTLGGFVRRILVVGVQPETLEDGLGLSDAVAAAVGPAARTVADLARRELGAQPTEEPAGQPAGQPAATRPGGGGP